MTIFNFRPSEELVEKALSGNGRAIYDFIKENPNTYRSQVVRQLRISDGVVNNKIRALVEANLIKRSVGLVKGQLTKKLRVTGTVQHFQSKINEKEI